MHEHPHPRPRKAVRPGRRQRHAVHLSTLLLLCSGVVWMLAHYLLPLPEDAARHPLEPWAMRAHGAAAMFGLAVLGSIWTTHVMPAWQRGTHRLSGGSLFLLWAGLILSGYGLYYLADETQRATTSWIHMGCGLLLPFGLLLHVLQAMRARRPTGGAA